MPRESVLRWTCDWCAATSEGKPTGWREYQLSWAYADKPSSMKFDTMRVVIVCDRCAETVCDRTEKGWLKALMTKLRG